MSERDPSYLWKVARDPQRSGLDGGGGGGCFLGPETGAIITTLWGPRASGALRGHSLGALAFRTAGWETFSRWPSEKSTGVTFGNSATSYA